MNEHDCYHIAETYSLTARYALAMLAYPDGQLWPYVLDTEAEDQNTWSPARIALLAPHEKLGRLPSRFKSALNPMCGARTKQGKACRFIVDHQGDRCQWHQGQEAL